MAEHKNSVYRRISEDIKSKIESGAYAKGSMLEPERKLMEIYGVERTTVRRALDVLVSEGVIVKRTGLGTFVSDAESVPEDEKKKPEAVVSKTARKSLPSDIDIVDDYSYAAELLFDRLEELGHEKVMFVGENSAAFVVIAGEAISRGMYDSELFVTTDDRYGAGYCFEKIWRSIRSGKPTAVLSASFEDAKEIIDTAHKMRISVPEELSVAALPTDDVKEIGGVVFDGKSVKKTLVSMLENTPDSKISVLNVCSNCSVENGSTITYASEKSKGSSSMSDYLL